MGAVQFLLRLPVSIEAIPIWIEVEPLLTIARSAALFACTAGLVVHTFSAAAQADRGSLAGSVSDTAKAVLQGAQIVLEPGGRTAVTGQEGSYILAGLSPGHYSVTVSYLGFLTYKTEIDVAAGIVSKADAVLSPGSESTSVEVRPEREVGEAEALNRQRVAANIVQVLPSEVINSLPNVNIADAVGRMPSVSVERDEGEAKYIQIRGTEPRLNYVTVDGVQLPSPENVRNVKLDTIPADLVESIEVNKTLTAAMDADGIGGTVNLVSREATDEPYFAVEGLLGHTPINGGRSQDQVFATYGRRYFADKKLGVLVTGSYDSNQRGINDIEPGQAVNSIAGSDQTVNAPNTIDLRNYFYDRSRYGLGSTLDYKWSDRSSTYLKGLYSYFDDFGEDTINRFNAGAFTSATTTDNTGNLQYQNIYRRPVQQIFSVSGGGKYDFGHSMLNMRAALSQAKLTGGFTTSTFNGPAASSDPADPTGNTLLNDGVGYSFSAADPFLPHLTPVVVPNNAGVYDPAQYSLASINFQNNHTFERDAVGQSDFSQSYTEGQAFGTWQIGFKVRDVVKNQIYNQSQAIGASPLLSRFLTDRGNGSYYFGQYQAGPQSRATQIQSYYSQNRTQFDVDPLAARNLRQDFKINERVAAGYAMNTLTYNRFRLNTGVRIEATSEAVRGYQPNTADVIAPVNLTGGYIYVLPSASLQYNTSDYTDFRAAYSIGLARPNYGDLAPYLTFNPTADGTAANPKVASGNPNLQPTWAHNLDLLGEHYLKSIGVIQGGLFYKMIYNDIATSIATVQYTPPGATAPQALLSQSPVNIGAAHLIGVEGSWEQHLTRLPGSFGGIGFRATYSYTTSVAGYPGRSDHPTLQRNAPNNYNFDTTYDKYGISARMGITHNDAYLWSYAYQDGTPIAGQPTTPTPGGVNGPQSDTYIYPHTQVDAQVSYLLPKGRGVSVVAQFLNLNNEVFGFYNGSERYPIQREYYSPTYTFGLRWTQSAEHGSIFHN